MCLTEHVDLCTYLYVLKGHAYKEVAGPVAAAGESNGRGSRPLAEQLGYYEPRNGTRTDLKETDEEEDSRHADVAHPWVITLEGGWDKSTENNEKNGLV